MTDAIKTQVTEQCVDFENKCISKIDVDIKNRITEIESVCKQ